MQHPDRHSPDCPSCPDDALPLLQAQISGIWVSDLFGHLCVLGCIPLTTLAIFAYRRAWMGWEFHPHIRKVSLTLLGLDSLISVFCLVMMIGSIKMWLGV